MVEIFQAWGYTYRFFMIIVSSGMVIMTFMSLVGDFSYQTSIELKSKITIFIFGMVFMRKIGFSGSKGIKYVFFCV